MKSYASKWILIGVDKKNVKRIYQNCRQKSKTILINNHKREYRKLLKKQLNKEYNELKNEKPI